MKSSKLEVEKQQQQQQQSASKGDTGVADTVIAGGTQADSNSSGTADAESSVWEIMPNREEFKQAVQFIITDAKDINSRWILKNMPNCAAQLQDETLTVKKFMEKFASGVTFGGIDPQIGGTDPHTNLSTTKSLNIVNIIWKDAVDLSFRALPKRFASNAGVDKDALVGIALELGRELLIYFTLAEVQQLGWEEDGQGQNNNFSSSLATFYPRLLDMVCEEYASKCDDLFFRGKRGTFLKKCPTYKKEARHFADLFEDPNRVGLRTKRFVKLRWLRRAAEAVADGTSHAHKTCWQCGSSGSVMNTCSSCEVSQYCGEKCQRKAWKQGHKSCCAELKKKKHDSFETNMAALVSLHESEIREGVEPAYDFDYAVFDDCINQMNGNYWGNTHFETTLAGPSFSCFIENLRQIRNGQFVWFFSETLPLDEYKAKISGKDGLLYDESILCNVIRKLLCYDFKDYIKKHGMSDASATDLYRKEFGFLLTTRQGQGHSRQMLLPVPAERFIELYDQSRGFGGSKKEQAAMLRKLRSESERQFVNILRNNNHNYAF